MASSTILPLQFLCFSLLCISVMADTDVDATSFIGGKCRATPYPSVCVRSLSIYANTIQRNPKRLAQTALSVSLQRAQATENFVSKLTEFKGLKPEEYAAIRSCLEETSDSVDRLSQSVVELNKIVKAPGPQLLWILSNVQTWVDAALTDYTACADGVAGSVLYARIKASIGVRVTNVARVTGNALALINQLAE